MAIKTEQLSQDTLDNIKSLQNEINSLIFDLGQISLRKRELEQENKRLIDIQKEIEAKVDNSTLQLENVLANLQQKYKNAEIDLNDGTVSFEISE